MHVCAQGPKPAWGPAFLATVTLVNMTPDMSTTPARADEVRCGAAHLPAWPDTRTRAAATPPAPYLLPPWPQTEPASPDQVGAITSTEERQEEMDRKKLLLREA
jgi:hypothetical protein